MSILLIRFLFRKMTLAVVYRRHWFGGDWAQGEGVAVSCSTGNMMVAAGGETPRTALRTRRATVCQVLCSVFYMVFVQHLIYFKDDKTTFRKVQYLVQGHTAKVGENCFLNLHLFV